MKKTILIFVAFLIYQTGCQRIEVQNVQDHNQIAASIEQFDGYTKTYLDALSVFWESNDQIAVFDHWTAKSCYQINEEAVGSSSGLFDCVSSPEEGAGDPLDVCVAYYPYSASVKCEKNEDGIMLTGMVLPEIQTFAKGTVAQNLLPMAVLSDEIEKLTFKNICGIVKIQLLGNGTITSVSIRGNADESLSGAMQILFDKNSIPCAVMDDSGSTFVTLDCGTAGVELSDTELTEFLIVLPPTVFSDGFEVVINDSNGNTETIRTEKKNVLKRSQILSMPVVEYKAGTVFYVSETLKEEYPISAFGGTLSFPVITNAELMVDIPKDAEDWISVVDSKVASEKNILLDVKENNTGSYRRALVTINTDDNQFEHTIIIEQLDQGECIVFKDGAVKAVCVEAFDKNGDGELSYNEAETVASFSDIHFPSDVTSFEEFQYFKSVSDIPESLFGDTRLSYIVMPESITSIGECAFKNCYYLTGIRLPDNVVSIGPEAFFGCNSLVDIVLSEKLKEIGSFAFYRCGMTSIEFPENVESIGMGAFNYCVNLNNVSFPTGISKIEDQMFETCYSLSNITIPDTVKEIGSRVFQGCTSLCNIKLPAGVTSIGSYAFSGCSALEQFEIPKTIKRLENALFFQSGLKNIEVPDNITYIGEQVFWSCKNLMEVILPNSVTYIGRETFVNCENLKTIGLPKYIDAIEYSCFSNCKSLEKIEIPDGVTVIRSGAFGYCDSLKSIAIPNSVTLIESAAFYNSKNLQEVILSENISSIGTQVFQNCSSLKKITIPAGVSTIKDYAFQDCISLEQVNLSANLTTIGYSSFSGCSALKNIVIPSEVSMIEGYAFSNSGLVEITIPEKVEILGIGTFASCESLKNATILMELTAVPTGLFDNCHSLNRVDIPETVLTIEDRAFACCSSLQEIDLPNNLETIHYYAFGESGLLSISLPDNVKSIGEMAFRECKELVSAVISENVQTIGKNLFYSCPSLTTVYMKPVVPPTGNGAFLYCDALKDIFVPMQSIDEYKSSDNWSQYQSFISGYDY